jgi:hypothetical protein
MRVLVIGLLAGLAFSSGTANADFIFGEPVNLGAPVNTSESWSGEPAISSDGLSLYFTSERSGGSGGPDIWVAKRPSTDDAWNPPVNMGPIVNSSAVERGPSISADNLELYFVTKRSGDWQVCMAARSSEDGDFGTPVVIQGIPRVGVASTSISSNGLELYFEVYKNESWYDIYVKKRAAKEAPWGAAERLGWNVNHQRNNYQNNDMQPCISSDGLSLFYSLGSGKVVDYELLMSTRPSAEEPWSPCIKLDAINSSGWDFAPCVSADGSMLYFESDRPGCIGGDDIWQAPIIPIVDLNGDGTVDVKDVVTLTDHWGENNSLCDIGPMPWGDGIVDVQDLLVLAEYLLPEPPKEPGLIAHWKLDETQDSTARDSVSGEDALVLGDPLWLPTDGMVDGALQFDGVDDFISAPAVLNPAEGPFSVFVWINGGAPGQVIIAQQTVSDWLSLDTEGNLMTDIKCSGRLGGPLLSEATITDGQWHRVGLVWDGSNRTLMVDDVIVAEDTPTTLESSGRGLYIGVGKDFSADTFFSGLIDDIHIYNRAVKP